MIICNDPLPSYFGVGGGEKGSGTLALCEGVMCRVSFRGVQPPTPHWNLFAPPPPPPLGNVLLKFIINVDKCLAKCMSSESMHV